MHRLLLRVYWTQTEWPSAWGSHQFYRELSTNLFCEKQRKLQTHQPHRKRHCKHARRSSLFSICQRDSLSFSFTRDSRFSSRKRGSLYDFWQAASCTTRYLILLVKHLFYRPFLFDFRNALIESNQLFFIVLSNIEEPWKFGRRKATENRISVFKSERRKKGGSSRKRDKRRQEMSHYKFIWKSTCKRDRPYVLAFRASTLRRKAAS